MKQLLPLLTGLVVLGTAVTAAQTAQDLKGQFAEESRQLDRFIDDYGRSRASERAAVDGLRRIHLRLDEALEDPNVTLDYLNSLERELATARDRACASLERTAQARRAMYDQMARLGAVAREIERQTELFGTSQEGLTGMWHLEVQPLDLYGLINLRLNGAQVSGPYRLSNGNQGSVQGTLAGNVLRLQAVDSERGVIADIKAEVDTEAGEIRGEWRSRELGSGLPSVGDWNADKVSSQEEIDLDY